MKKDKYKVIRYTISALINPVSPVMTLLVGGIISLIINKVSEDSNILIEKAFYFLIMWFILTVAYQINISNNKIYKNEIDKLSIKLGKKDDIIKEKDKQIVNNIGLIEAKYGEFSEFIKDDKYKKIISKVVNKFTYVEAIYIHNFYIYIRNNNVVIKVLHKIGTQNEDINVNTIMQQYFHIDKQIFTNYRDICKDYSILNEDSTEHLRIFELNCLKFIKTLMNNMTPENKRIITLVFDKLTKVFKTDEYDDIHIDEDVFRTGILGSILSNEDYLYDYEKENHSKPNRSYITFNDIIDDEGATVTLVINTNSVEKIDKEIIVNNVTSYYYELKEKL